MLVTRIPAVQRTDCGPEPGIRRADARTAAHAIANGIAAFATFPVWLFFQAPCHSTKSPAGPRNNALGGNSHVCAGSSCSDGRRRVNSSGMIMSSSFASGAPRQ
jgi:hypothetical protein